MLCGGRPRGPYRLGPTAWPYARRAPVPFGASIACPRLELVSVARGEDRPGSDVDLLVDVPPDMGLLGLGRVQAELEAILGTKVDLVPASDLKPAVRARAERDLVAL